MSLSIRSSVRGCRSLLLLIMGCGSDLETQTHEHQTVLAAPAAMTINA